MTNIKDLEDLRSEEIAVDSIVADLTHRTKLLLEELQVFRSHLQDLRQDSSIEVRQFRGTVESELGMLERLAQKADQESSRHIARSSNLPFLETLWNVAKRSQQIRAFQKRIYYGATTKTLSQGLYRNNPPPRQSNSRKTKDSKKDSVTVDLVAEGGLTWTKLSLLTNSRILFDLAKLGWQSDGSSDAESETSAHFKTEDDEDDIPLIKMVKDLCQAAQSFRVRVQHPTVHLVLPRVKRGETAEVDRVIEACEAAGAVVICAQVESEYPKIREVLHSMAPDPYSAFSETLNIDCTILLALVSEFSHARVSKEPWFHTALKRQVEIEGNENLLPSVLYPALGSHPLVCTKEAALRMREIVDTIGTPSEKARTAIMMGDDNSKTQEQLIDEMQQWSAYAVPSAWQLPIRQVDKNADDCRSTLPPQAATVAESLTDINDSVFLYGWASNRTTITSNRTVVKRMESDLEQFDDINADLWPKVWLCPTARSLVGKEKERRDIRNLQETQRKAGVWPLPDPLRREEQRRHGLDVLSQREGHPVEDLRPDGYPCEEVLEAKKAAFKKLEDLSLGNTTSASQ